MVTKENIYIYISTLSDGPRSFLSFWLRKLTQGTDMFRFLQKSGVKK